MEEIGERERTSVVRKFCTLLILRERSEAKRGSQQPANGRLKRVRGDTDRMTRATSSSSHSTS